MQDIKNKTMKITLAQILLPFIGIIILPSGVLIAWMCVALVADLITGILRAIIDNKIRTSQGYRETLAKVIQYGGALIIGIILGSIGKTHTHGVNPEVFEYYNDFLVSFIIFIEVTSIMENLYAIDSKSKLSKYL